MARKASTEAVSDAIRPADYRGAVQLIRTIDAKKDKIAGVTSEIGDIWAKVEGKKVDKGAGKIFARLDHMDPEDRVTTMRALNRLIDVAGWEETAQDLVDKAEGNVVEMRAGGKAKAMAEADGEDAPGKEDGPASEADAPPPTGAALERFKATRAKANDHLGSTPH